MPTSLVRSLAATLADRLSVSVRERDWERYLVLRMPAAASPGQLTTRRRPTPDALLVSYRPLALKALITRMSNR